ncbi:MAG TPA: helix-turn-helix transcriptional regulator [Vicinamibacterales bacterium]|nr:helix-turn-helix transcriptional regulator [Vicinamibacterales bacterium]
MRPEQKGPWAEQDRSTSPTIEPRRFTLIGAGGQFASRQPSASLTESSFGVRLRLERERRRVTLASVSAETKIGLGLLEGLERDDLSRWPNGIFRRAFIRAYAEAIGLDAEQTARSFLEQFPDPAEPGSARSRSSADGHRSSGGEGLRLTLAATGLTTLESVPGVSARQRWAAAAWDLGVVFAISIMLFVLLHTFWVPLAVTMLGYYGASIVLFGNTPGVSLFARS